MNYYTLDIGYSFIVEAARLAFPSLPDNHLRALALQLLADAALLVLRVSSCSRSGTWRSACWRPICTRPTAYFSNLVSFAYYYYWDIPLTFIVLGSLLLAYRRPDRAASGWR